MKIITAFFAVLFLLTTTPATAQWIQPEGPFGGEIRSIVKIGSTMFAGSDGDGVYSSTDKGEHWKANPLSSVRNTYSLAVIDTVLFAFTEGKIYKSLDKAQTWSVVNHEKVYVRSMMVNGNELYAGGDEDTIYLSTNKGDTWKPISTKINDRFAISLVARDTILFQLNFDLRLYRSIDKGIHWTPIITGHEASKITLCDTTLFISLDSGKIYYSTNNGDSWHKAGSSLPVADESYLLRVYGKTIVAYIPRRSYFKSTDGGVTWSSSELDRFSEKGVSAVVQIDSMVFAASDIHGIWRMKADDNKWEQVNTGLSNCKVNSLVKRGANLFAAIDYNALFQSADNGSTWSRVYPDFSDRDVLSMAATDSVIFLGTYFNGVSKCTDNGVSWVQVNEGIDYIYSRIHSVALKGNNTVYVGSTNALFRGTYSQENYSWQKSWNTTDDYNIVSSIAVHGETIFAAADKKGIVRSIDNGETWTEHVMPDNKSVLSVAVHGTTVFAGTRDGSLYRSTDNGESWSKANIELTESTVTSIVSNGVLIFIGTYDGVFYSSNNGDNWQEINIGLRDKYIVSLFISENTLFAGTGLSGISILDISTLVSVEEGKQPSRDDELGLVCYPNPATNSFTIDRTTLQFPENSPIHYTFSTLIGGKVMEFDNSELKFTVSLDGLMSGVYCLTAESRGNRSVVMVTVK